MKSIIIANVIVKNEENLIEQCVSQLDWCDWIYVLDTGSLDGTKEKLVEMKQTNSKLFTYNTVFKNHFGDHRNLLLSITAPKADWIFVLDADEILEEGLSDEMLKLSIEKPNDFDVLYIPRKNYINDAFQREAYPDHQLRFFKPFCRYIYAVHEELVGWKKPIVVKKHILHHKSHGRWSSQQTMYKSLEKQSRNQVKVEDE